jgi:CRISPR-associated endonuclease Csn1
VRRPFSPDGRKKLIDALDSEGSLSFKEAKKRIGVKNNWTFNFESGGETRFQGNRTAAKLGEVFGARWGQFTADQKDAVIADLLSIQRPETLKRRAKRVWGLAGEWADAFAELELEDGHGSLSRKALRKILPELDRWLPEKNRWASYAEACLAAGYKPPSHEPLPLLPPLKDAAKRKLMPEVRNPAVMRTLSELRKVVNGLIARYGLPGTIRVELGRDLRNPRDKREKMWKANRAREKEREKAAKKILDATGDAHPSRQDIEKVLLAEECGWQCPYTGKVITPATLLGQHPQFDTEHIIPYSLCLDDSFLNKTLCEAMENRSRKRNKAPWAAYSADEKRWEDIVGRVKAFKGDATRAKLERFQTQDTSVLLADFTTRQLNDTRYAARLAMEYLGLLYGGTTDADGTRRVQVAQGRITADLRGSLRLASILRDGGAEQKRDDHRHHAVDAVAVALTNPSLVKTMSDFAAARALEGRKGIGQINSPWEGFLEQVRVVIDGAKVSHRPSHTVSGRLHEDTIYSPPKKDADGKEWVHVRKRLDTLSKNDVEGIVDPVVRQAVQAKLAETGGDDPKKLDLEKNPPMLKTKHGGTVPIRKARIRRPPSVFAIGPKPHQRHVVSDANHHAEIVAVKDAKGRVKWEGHIVPLHEAYRRLKAKDPVVKKDHGEDKRFLFSLAPGDLIELDSKSGDRTAFRVRGISYAGGRYLNVEYVRNNDAKLKKEIKASKHWYTGLIDPLRKLDCRKVTITPLGEVRYAND